MHRTQAIAVALALLMTGCTTAAPDDPADHFPATPAITVLASRLTAPWGLAFLPDGSALLSERDTRLIKAVGKDGTVRTVQQVTAADSSGEGGLLGITVSPDYARDRLVYAYYTTAEDNRIARFKLGEEPEPIVTGIPVSGIHNGGRIAFGPDGYLYAGTGDASERGRSQDITSLGGKVLRMTPDGKPAPDNPFPGSLVWSYGHRNVQGLAWDARGRLYASEFGQNRHDEVNLIQPRHNYGWPAVEGIAGKGVGAGRFTDPLVTWAPSEASPSGIAILAQAVYVACLRGERLWRIPIRADGKLGRPQSLLVGRYGRLRHVAVAPDGSLWVLTSNRDGRGDPVAADDRLLRLDPKKLVSPG